MPKNFDQSESWKIKFHSKHKKRVSFESTCFIEFKTGLSLKIGYGVLEEFRVKNRKFKKKWRFFSKKILIRRKILFRIRVFWTVLVITNQIKGKKTVKTYIAFLENWPEIEKLTKFDDFCKKRVITCPEILSPIAHHFFLISSELYSTD